MQRLIAYLNDDERWHEHGHVWGYGFAALTLLPLVAVTRWFYVVVAVIMLGWAVYQELVIERWWWHWPSEPWASRKDLFYDLLSKGVYSTAWASGITYLVNPTEWGDALALLGVAIAAQVLPYKSRIFR